MSNFNDRVLRVIQGELDNIRDLFYDDTERAKGIEQPVDLTPIVNKCDEIYNLLKEAKREIRALEKNQPEPQQPVDDSEDPNFWKRLGDVFNDTADIFGDQLSFKWKAILRGLQFIFKILNWKPGKDQPSLPGGEAPSGLPSPDDVSIDIPSSIDPAYPSDIPVILTGWGGDISFTIELWMRQIKDMLGLFHDYERGKFDAIQEHLNTMAAASALCCQELNLKANEIKANTDDIVATQVEMSSKLEEIDNKISALQPGDCPSDDIHAHIGRVL